MIFIFKRVQNFNIIYKKIPPKWGHCIYKIAFVPPTISLYHDDGELAEITRFTVQLKMVRPDRADGA